MNEPSISIILPCFNAGRYLEPAVRSMLSQTVSDFELLLMDDASTDGSADLIERLAGEDDRVRPVLGAHRGIAALLESGVRAARGAYVARMDADDVALPDRFEKQLAYLEQHPECVAVGGQAYRIDEDGCKIGPWSVPLEHADIDNRHMAGEPGQVIHPTTMFRREAVLRAGNYNPAFELAEDFDLYLRLAEIGRLANLPDVVLHYRLHARGLSVAKRNRQVEVVNRVLEEAYRRRGRSFPPRLAPVRDVRAYAGELLVEWINLALHSGHNATARGLLRRNGRLLPLATAARYWVKACAGDQSGLLRLYRKLCRKGARAHATTSHEPSGDKQ